MLFNPDDIRISNIIKVDVSIERDVVNNECEKRYEILGEIKIDDRCISFDNTLGYSIEIVDYHGNEFKSVDLIIKFLDGKITYNFKTMLAIDIVENNKIQLFVNEDYYKDMFENFKDLIDEIYIYLKKYLIDDLKEVKTKYYMIDDEL